MDWLGAVDAYLYLVARMGLEQVLCDGCLIGRLDQRLGAAARVVLRERRVEHEDDGGEIGFYAGLLILDGLWYQFACQIFIDGGGQSFLADLTQFAAIEWKLRLAV